MRTITLFDYGDKVSPTAVWVALQAIEDCAEDVQKHIEQAKKGVGVITDVYITQGRVKYSVEWRTPIAPNYVAWFEEDELRSAMVEETFELIPFDAYRNDWRSTNREYEKQLREDLKKSLDKSLRKLIANKIVIHKGNR